MKKIFTFLLLFFLVVQAPSYAVFQPYFQLPSQSGQSGKCLGTDGTNPSWVSCDGGGPSYAQVSRVNFTSSAITSTYTTVASPSLVLGTSTGPTGAWDVTVELSAEGVSSLGAVSMCIEGTNAGTNAAGNQNTGNAGTPCSTAVGTPTNPLAGGSPRTSSVTSYPGLSTIRYSAQYANGATVSFTCVIAVATNQNMSGYCIERAIPI